MQKREETEAFDSLAKESGLSLAPAAQARTKLSVHPEALVGQRANTRAKTPPAPASSLSASPGSAGALPGVGGAGARRAGKKEAGTTPGGSVSRHRCSRFRSGSTWFRGAACFAWCVARRRERAGAWVGEGRAAPPLDSEPRSLRRGSWEEPKEPGTRSSPPPFPRGPICAGNPRAR